VQPNFVTVLAKGMKSIYNSLRLAYFTRVGVFLLLDAVHFLVRLKTHVIFCFENGTIEEKCNLKSFVDACKYIFQNDMPRFEAILYNLSDAYLKTGSKAIEGVMAQIERFE
jgi:hypothetical protein